MSAEHLFVIHGVCCFRSQSSKAEVAKMSSDVTESLLSLSRSLSAQVQSGEQTLHTLGLS